MILIGLGHKARQGKNYVANYMKEQNHSIKLYAFADELKQHCKDNAAGIINLWKLEHYPEELKAPKEDPIFGYTQILQWYGTEIARKADPNTWVKALDNRLRSDATDFAIVTDVRFPNEAAYIKEKGGYLVEVIRQNTDGTQYLDPGRDPKHESETALDEYDGWDFIIQVKDGDLKGLRSKSIGVWNLVNDPTIYETYYVDEPDYADAVMQSIDSQGDGFAD